MGNWVEEIEDEELRKWVSEKAKSLGLNGEPQVLNAWKIAWLLLRGYQDMNIEGTLWQRGRRFVLLLQHRSENWKALVVGVENKMHAFVWGGINGKANRSRLV